MLDVEDRSLSSLRRSWVELIGVFGVVASLIFVGLEVRQNTAAVRGATYQAIADSSLQQVVWFADNEKLLQLWVRIRDDGAMPTDFTPEQNLMISANYVMTIRRIENIYVQVREGLVEEEAVLRFRPSEDYFQSPYFLQFWKGWRPQMESAFLAYFESEFLQ
jgi:hypothetical protein